jgi:RNA polymerase sigma factor FliA
LASVYGKTENQIVDYLPLVKRVVSRMDCKDPAMDGEDLFSIGVMGLMEALERYDESKNIPFEAYATIRIKGAVMDELRRVGRVSRDRMDRLNGYYRAKEDLEKQFLRSPMEKEIQERLGLDEKELEKIHETVHLLASVSLEATLCNDDGEGFALVDSLKDPSEKTPETSLLEEEEKSHLSQAVAMLDVREQTILQLYYVEELNLKEIAYVLEISIPRVSQLHGRCILRLRENLQKLTGVKE